MFYFFIHCILKQEIVIHDLLRGLHDFRALGNPTWFIIMTLIAYILTFISFKAWGRRSPMAVVAGLSGMLIVAINLVHLHKPSHWVNTIFCFPAGMLFYLKGAEIEGFHKKTKIPSLFYALLLIVTGRLLYGISCQPSIAICTQNLGSILFAIGVTWFVGSFSWKSPSRLLIWLGGSGLFTVYMFHLLPMRIITALQFNLANPFLIWFCVIATTAVLAISFNYLYKIINNILFIKT